MANGAGIAINLPVVSAFEGLVAEEVDVLVLDAAGFLGLFRKVSETVGLVPAGGEDVERDLASNGVTGKMI